MGWPDTGRELPEYINRVIGKRRLDPARFKIMTLDDYVKFYDWLVTECARVDVLTGVPDKIAVLAVSLTNVIADCVIVDKYLVNSETNAPIPLEISLERLLQAMYKKERAVMQKKERGKSKMVSGKLGAPFMTVYQVRPTGEIRCQLRKDTGAQDSKQFLSVLLTVELLLQRIEMVHGKYQPFKVGGVSISRAIAKCNFPFQIDARALEYVCARNVKDPPISVLQTLEYALDSNSTTISAKDSSGNNGLKTFASHAVYYEYQGSDLTATLQQNSVIPFCTDLRAHPDAFSLLSSQAKRVFTSINQPAFQDSMDVSFAGDAASSSSSGNANNGNRQGANSMFIIHHGKNVPSCLSGRSWLHLICGYERLYNDVVMSMFAKKVLVKLLVGIYERVISFLPRVTQIDRAALPQFVSKTFDTGYANTWSSIDIFPDDIVTPPFIRARAQKLMVRAVHTALCECGKHSEDVHFVRSREIDMLLFPSHFTVTPEERPTKRRKTASAANVAAAAPKIQIPARQRHRNAMPTDSGFTPAEGFPVRSTTGTEQLQPCLMQLFCMDHGHSTDITERERVFEKCVSETSDVIWKFIKTVVV